MKLTRSTAIAALGTFALAACSQAETNNQVAADTAPAAAPGANDAAANVTNAAGSDSPAGTGAPASTSVSSGMPVPGTNTPEHIVVNEDGANGSDNRL